MKVYVERGEKAYEQMFLDAGCEIVPLKDAEVVCFTGGADVNATLYGEANHFSTYFNNDRDASCIRLWKVCQERKLHAVGICRGGQFLNVMNGGKLFQDVNNHAISGTHEAITNTGEVVQVTSTHHQMMIPHKSGEVIMHADGLSTARRYMCDGEEVIECKPQKDVEAVYYAQTQSLCFQPHPEFANNKDTRRVFYTFLKEFIAGDK